MDVVRVSVLAVALVVGLAVPAGAVWGGGGPAAPSGTATEAVADRPVAERTAGPTGAAAAGTVDQARQPRVQGVDTDRIRLIVAVQADGDAVWTVEYRTDLDDENTTAAFDTLAADIERNPGNYTERFADRIGDTVGVAENATGRSMAARNVTVSARTGISQGVVAYGYEWTNFARTDGDRVVVGDAVAGFFLDDRTSLRVQWPEGYAPTTVAPGADSRSERSLAWDGDETSFGPEQPRVVLTRGATIVPTATSAAGTGTGENEGGGFPVMLVGGVLALVVAVTAVAVRRRSGRTANAPATGPEPPASADAGTDTGAGPDPSEGSTPTAADADDGEGESDDGEGTTAVDEELLSNEERVLRLLAERGGRVKQQEVVDALGWTEAKTSQVVSGMREDGTIDGFRLGRENVLTLPDEDVTEDGGEDDAN